MSRAKRSAEKWKQDIQIRAKIFHKKIKEIEPLYGHNPVVPTQNEISHAFALSLIDIGRYCVDNNINARNIDTVKLMSFSIPHLLSIRNFALRIDMYIHACLLVIHANDTPVLDHEKIKNTANVSIHLCSKYPSQHLVVYGYLKGYQESLELYA